MTTRQQKQQAAHGALTVLAVVATLSAAGAARAQCISIPFDGETEKMSGAGGSCAGSFHEEGGLGFESWHCLGAQAVEGPDARRALRVMSDLVVTASDGGTFTPESFDCRLAAAMCGAKLNEAGESRPQKVTFTSSAGGEFTLSACTGTVFFPAGSPELPAEVRARWRNISWFAIDASEQCEPLYLADLEICAAAGDSDGDGVPDDVDLCPGTGSEEPSKKLDKKRWMDLDGDGRFDTGDAKYASKKYPVAPWTLADTFGCNCTQIVYLRYWNEKKGKLGGGAKSHLEHGCKTGLFEKWRKEIEAWVD